MARRREERLKFLQELLRSQTVKTQQELVDALKKRGDSITQASLSRDLAYLGVVKQGSSYLLPESKSSSSILRITQAGDNLLVIRTMPGMAPPLAYKIDELKIEGVVGTIAGEDTIFVAVHPEIPIGRIRQRLSRLL